MSRRLLTLCLAIGCLGIGLAAGFLIWGRQTTPSVSAKTSSLGTVTRLGTGRVRMPDIVGLNLETALSRVRGAGLAAQVNAFRIKDRPRGIVIAQAPTPAIWVTKGTTVVVDVSAGDSLRPFGVADCELVPPDPLCRGGIAIIHVVG
jgi:PASTA domain